MPLFVCAFCLSQADADNTPSHVPVRIVLVDFVTKSHNPTRGDPRTYLCYWISESRQKLWHSIVTPFAICTTEIGFFAAPSSEKARKGQPPHSSLLLATPSFQLNIFLYLQFCSLSFHPHYFCPISSLKEGMTTAMVAVQNGFAGCVLFLLEAGVDVGRKDKHVSSCHGCCCPVVKGRESLEVLYGRESACRV